MWQTLSWLSRSSDGELVLDTAERPTGSLTVIIWADGKTEEVQKAKRCQEVYEQSK